MSDEVNILSDRFQKLPTNTRKFSRYLETLYEGTAVSFTLFPANFFDKTCDQTRQYAIVYVKGLLPLCIQMVINIQGFFEFNEELELDECKARLPGILEEVTGYQQCCTEIVRMHKEMILPLKKRQDEAKKKISELKDLNKLHMQDQTKLKEKAAKSKAWAIGLAWVPIVGTIASPLLNNSAENDLAEAAGAGDIVSINEAEIKIVSDALIPALSGLNSVACFFTTINDRLAVFHNIGEKTVESIKRYHYMMMKRKAVEIKGCCQTFYAIILAVQTELQCIPDKMDDQNNVEKWQIKQEGEIRRKYPKTLTSQLRDLLKIFGSV